MSKIKCISDLRQKRILIDFISKVVDVPANKIATVRVNKKGTRLIWNHINNPGGQTRVDESLVPEAVLKFAKIAVPVASDYDAIEEFLKSFFLPIDAEVLSQIVEEAHPMLQCVSLKRNHNTIIVDYCPVNSNRLCTSKTYQVPMQISEESTEEAQERYYQNFRDLLKKGQIIKAVNKDQLNLSIEEFKDRLLKAALRFIEDTYPHITTAGYQDKMLRVSHESCSIYFDIDLESILKKNLSVYLNTQENEDGLIAYSFDNECIKKALQANKDIIMQTLEKAKGRVNNLRKMYSKHIREALDIAQISSWRTMIGPSYMDKESSSQNQDAIQLYYKIKSGHFFGKNAYGVAEIDECGNLVNVSRTDLYKRLKKNASSARCKSAIKFFNEQLMKHQISTIRPMTGAGVLVGSTGFKVRINGRDVLVDYAGHGLDDNLTTWKKDIQNAFNNAANTVENYYKQQFEANKNKIEKFANNFLAIDLAKYIDANTNHMTEYAAACAMRGTKVQLDANVTDTDAVGRYNLLSMEEIQNMEHRLVKDDFLYREYVRGTYYDFSFIHSNTLSSLLSSYKMPVAATEAELAKRIQNGETLNDLEAEKVFLKYRKKEIPKYQMLMIGLFGVKGFVCKYQSDLVEYYSKADNAIFDYMKMMEDVTEDPFQIKVLKRIRIDAQRQQKADASKIK